LDWSLAEAVRRGKFALRLPSKTNLRKRCPVVGSFDNLPSVLRRDA
jgi:hypothetical protein